MNKSAENLAQYIFDSDVQHIDYGDWIAEGKDPREHILWDAAQVLGLLDSDGFAEELEQWEQSPKKKVSLSAFEL